MWTAFGRAYHGKHRGFVLLISESPIGVFWGTSLGGRLVDSGLEINWSEAERMAVNSAEDMLEQTSEELLKND